MARVLFARVGWMKRYLGPTPDDPKPIGGGKYNEDHVGGEAWNFLPIEGLCRFPNDVEWPMLPARNV